MKKDDISLCRKKETKEDRDKCFSELRGLKEKKKRCKDGLLSETSKRMYEKKGIEREYCKDDYRSQSE